MEQADPSPESSKAELRLAAGPCILRRWLTSDAPSVAHHANNRKIWRNLRDRFPSPYTLSDAEDWVTNANPTWLCIEYNGEAVGGIGFTQKDDVERCTAEVGYWIGEDLWGKGLMTQALVAISKWAFESTPVLQRLFALPFARNRGSRRVLEKGGYELDAVLKRMAIKEGEILDEALYSLLRPEEAKVDA